MKKQPIKRGNKSTENSVRFSKMCFYFQQKSNVNVDFYSLQREGNRYKTPTPSVSVDA